MNYEALLFDCDGVLVDSEAITNGVPCAMLNEAGWALVRIPLMADSDSIPIADSVPGDGGHVARVS